MVVLQINKFFWMKGGAERYFFMVSRELERRGHRVVHFSMDHPNNIDSPNSGYFVSQKDYETPARTLDVLARAASFIRSREAAKNIRRLVREVRPDVAHLHNIYHQLTPSIIAALDDAGVPVVMTLHDYKLVCPNYSHMNGSDYCYACKGGKYFHAVKTRCRNGSLAQSALLCAEAYWQRITGVYTRVRRYIAPSRYMLDHINDETVSTGIPLDRVVYLPSFLPGSDGGARDSAGAENAAPEGVPGKYVLYFGRLSLEKGMDTLLDAAGALPDVPFVLCGDGPYRTVMERRVAETRLANVFFAGYVDKPRLDRIVERAAVVVLPSICTENAPFTVLEAAAAGVPVVVSDMGGLPEMAGIVSGDVFPAGGGAMLAGKVKALWDDPEAARERGAVARAAATEYFDRERHMRALEEIYNQVTGRS